MENELCEHNINLTQVLNGIGQWEKVIEYDWKNVTNVEIINKEYCLLILGLKPNQETYLYKYEVL